MKRLTATERKAFSQYHPAKKPVCFQVISCGVAVFEGDVRLCWSYIRTNNLNGKPKPKYQ